MYFALGLLVAGMLALLVTPAIWRRATRLMRQRIENSVPMTLAEIQADKDHLRAEFAMSARRLEMAADRLREKTTEQTLEVNRKRAEIVRLSNERNDQAETIRNYEASTAKLTADLKTLDEQLAKARDDITQREAVLAERTATLGVTQARLEASQQLNDEQKLELVARATEIGNLNDQLADLRARHDAVATGRDRLADALAAEQASLAAERRRTENLEGSLARIEAERIDRLAELERRATEAQELAAELARNRAHAEDLAARMAEIEADRAARLAELERLRDAAAGREDGTTSLVTPLAEEAAPADGDNIAKAIAATEAEKSALAARLARIEADNAELRAENDRLRQADGADPEIAAENALLRERLQSVAAEVIRIVPAPEEARAANGEEKHNGSSAGEEPAAPIPLHRPAGNGAATVAADAPPTGAKTLAERLRALQHAAASR
jgi:chromosome segregation ATPase